MPSYTVKSGALNDSTTRNIQRKLARTSNGTLWCVYHRSDGTYNQIYASYSTNEGETWVEERVTNATDHQYRPSIAIDSNDNIHVVWYGRSWGTNPSCVNIQYRKRTSSGWQAQEAITDKSDNQYYPSIAIDSNDNIHIVWYGPGWGTNTKYSDIQYRKRTSAGWQAQEAVTDKSDVQYYASIAIDSSDNIHVVWCGKGWGTNTGCYNIRYRKRTSSGWQTQEAITDKGDSQYAPSIAVDSNDNIHVVWLGLGWEPNPDYCNIRYRKRTSSGWQTQEAVTNKNNGQYYPSIAIDSNDNIHVVWCGYGWGTNTGRYNIQYRKRTSAGWQTQIGLTDASVHQYYPNLIWALHPTVSGVKTNRSKSGYAFVWVDETTLKFYKSSDLNFVTITFIHKGTAWRLLTTLNTTTAWKFITGLNAAIAWRVLTYGSQSLSWKLLDKLDTPTAWRLPTSKALSWKLLTYNEQPSSWKLLTKLDTITAWKVITELDVVTTWGVLTSNDQSLSWVFFGRLHRNVSWRILTKLRAWRYRKALIIRGTPGAGYNYQILLKVGESPSATDAHFSVKSDKFPSGTDDSGDLRFTLSDGMSVLPMWTEKVTGAAPHRTAYIWVKVTDNLDNNVGLFCYSGNPDADNVSDINSVFIKVINGVVFSLDGSLKDRSGNGNDFQLHMSNPMQQVNFEYLDIFYDPNAKWIWPYPQCSAPTDPLWIIRPFYLNSPALLTINVSADDYSHVYLDDDYLGSSGNWTQPKSYTINAGTGPHLLRISGGNYFQWSPSGVICSVSANGEVLFRTQLSDQLWASHTVIAPWGPTKCESSFAFAGGLVRKSYRNHSFKGEVTVDPWDVALTGSIKIFASGYIEYCNTLSPEESLKRNCRRLNLDAVEQLMVFKCSDDRWYSLNPEVCCSNDEIDTHHLPYSIQIVDWGLFQDVCVKVDIPSGLAVEQICDVESVSLKCTADNEYNLDVAIEATPYNVQAGHYIKCNSTTGVSNTKMSMCVWYYPVDFKEETPFCYIRCTGTTSARFFYFSAWQPGGPYNSLHLGTLTPDGYWGRGVTSGTVLDTTRKWYFYSGVINNSIGKVTGYVNATQVASQTFATGPTPGTPTEIWIGGTPENYQWTNGFICKPIFFAEALTPEDIQLMYENTYYTTPYAPGKALIRKFVCPEPAFASALPELDKFPNYLLIYKARNFGLWESMGTKQSITYAFETFKFLTLSGADQEIPKYLRAVTSTSIKCYGVEEVSFDIDELTTGLMSYNAVTPLLPFRVCLINDAPAGSDVIYVSDTSEFIIGNPAIMSSYQKGYEEYAYVINKSGNELYLHRELANSYKTGDYVIPAIVGICKVKGRQSLVHHKVFVSEIDATERFFEWRFIQPEETEVEKLTFRPKTNKILSKLIDIRDTKWEDSGYVSVSYPPYEKTPVEIEHKYTFIDPTWKGLRRAFFYTKSYGKTIQVPTWCSDLTVVELSPTGSTLLKVKPVFYYNIWARYAKLLLEAGTKTQEVEVTNCSLEPGYCELTLNTPLQFPMTQGSVAHFLLNVRFLEDNLTLDFIGYPSIGIICTTTVKWKEV